MRFAFLLVVVSLGLFGCKSKCRQLSERICECALNSNERTNCLNRVGSAEGSNPATADQEAYCMSLLAPGGCDCRLIGTREGKIRCGLARDPDGLTDGGS